MISIKFIFIHFIILSHEANTGKDEEIISWNVNGIKERLEAVKRLSEELQPDVICCQKVMTKGSGFITVSGYFTWWRSMDGGLVGGVSTFIKLWKGIELDSMATEKIYLNALDNT